MRALRYEVISNQILDKLIDDNRINIQYHDVYAYAIEKFLAAIVNIVLLTAAAILFGITRETVVFILYYMPLRKYAGGIHAETRTKCIMISLLLMVLFIKLSSIIILSDYWKISAVIIILGVLLAVFRFAPVDTENKRLSPENRIKHARIARRISIIECLILVCSILIIPGLKLYIMTALMAMLLVGIAIIPLKKLRRK